MENSLLASTTGYISVSEKGDKGDAGEDALRVEVSPKQLVISVDKNGTLMIDNETAYLPGDIETVYLTAYKGKSNVTGIATLELSTPSDCNFKNNDEGKYLYYKYYNTGIFYVYISPFGIETTQYTLGDKVYTLPKTASFVRAKVTYKSESVTVDIPIFVEFAVYNGGLKSDIYGLNATYTSLESVVSKIPDDVKTEANLTAYTSSIKANSKEISLSVSKEQVGSVKNSLKSSGIDLDSETITLSSDKVYITDGTNKNTLIEGGKIKAECVDVETVVADGIKAADIDAEGATISNLTITGASRSPFKEIKEGMTNEFTDNLSLVNSSSMLNITIKDVSVKQVGRLVHLVNYRWGSNYHQSTVSTLTLPSGYYFFENGVKKSTIKVSRECITMLGIGDDSNFYGWVILGRVDVIPNQKYGREKKVLAYGKVTGTSTDASIDYATFEGDYTYSGKMSVSRDGTGIYTVTYPSDWNIGRPFVMLTGLGYVYGASNSPAKATLVEASGTQMTVNISNGESLRDGSFYFEISNWDDFIL